MITVLKYYSTLFYYFFYLDFLSILTNSIIFIKPISNLLKSRILNSDYGFKVFFISVYLPDHISYR